MMISGRLIQFCFVLILVSSGSKKKKKNKYNDDKGGKRISDEDLKVMEEAKGAAEKMQQAWGDGRPQDWTVESIVKEGWLQHSKECFVMFAGEGSEETKKMIKKLMIEREPFVE